MNSLFLSRELRVFAAGPALLGVLFFAGCGGEKAPPSYSEQGVSSPETAPSPQPTEEPARSSTAPRVTPAKGFGNAQGRVLFDGKPAANIEVRLCESINFISGCAGKTFRAKTDKEGNYTIDKVEPGEYALAVQIFETDSFLYPTTGILSASKFVVEEGKTLDIRATNLWKTDLVALSPKAGEDVKSGAPKLSWKAHPSAAQYEIRLAPKNSGGEAQTLKTSANFVKPETPLLNGDYTWSVETTNASGTKIAETRAPIPFKISGQAGSSVVELETPKLGATIGGAGVKLAWKKHPLADGYQVYLNKVGGTNAILSFENVSETSYSLSENLEAGEYFWSVNAQKGGKKIAASELQRFKVQ